MTRPEYEKVAPAHDDETDSDVERHDGLNVRHLRSSGEVRRHDRETIGAEEEAEELLAGERGLGKIFGRRAGSRQARAGRRESRRRSRRSEKGEESDLLYTMEEGPRNSDESSGNSSEVDLQTLKQTQAKQKSQRPTRLCLPALLSLVLFLFLALLYGAYRTTSLAHRPSPPKATPLSNGTSAFLPTTILLSLDGFRADFLHRNITPALSLLTSQGVSPKYMLPSFPSLTFPNHFTLVTGLYPESHGVVGNTFWDPDMGREFTYAEKEKSMQPEWWPAEPLWVKAEREGVRTGVHMWPGSEAHIAGVEPMFVDQYDGHEALDNKVKRILAWLDLPGPQDEGWSEGAGRPQFIAAYVPNVDSDGHKFGPNSTEIRSTIAEVDAMLASLLDGLEGRNLTEIVNVIVVSDHGMATTSTSRLIQFEDLLSDTRAGVDAIEHIDGWPLYGLRPYNDTPEYLAELYHQLWSKSKSPEYDGSFRVYSRDFTMPERYHFSRNPRIAPLWLVPKTGWAIVTKEEFDVAEGLRNGDVYSPRGLHGYDYEDHLMRAIFLARGPAFPHEAGSELQPFQNTEVYNIVCDSLGLAPNPNNGTLRLPLRPVGVHDHEALELPEDPPLSAILLAPDLPVTPDLSPTPSPPTPPTQLTSLTPPTPSSSQIHLDSPGPGSQDNATATKEANSSSWWSWLHDTLQGAQGWALDLFGGHKKNGTITVSGSAGPVAGDVPAAETAADGSLVLDALRGGG